MVWIKICGITSMKDAESVSRMDTDSLGFIFSTDSPRRIGLEQAKEVIKAAGNTFKTGVFVNEKIEKISGYVRRLGLDYVQLSGDEETSYIREIKHTLPEIKIIKAFRTKKDDRGDNKKIIDDFLEYADHILLDSYDKDKYGGTGKTLDWQDIKDLVDRERLIISGGLDHENVPRVLSILDPYGVDASSRLEISPGKKDLERVESFITAVRGFEEKTRGK